MRPDRQRRAADQGGTIKAYAIATPERNPALPDVPTTKEAGLPEFQVSAWNALFAPKGTPKPIVDKLTDALDKALDDEATRKRLLELGSDIPDKASRGRQALLALVKSEIAQLDAGHQGGRARELKSRRPVETVQKAEAVAGRPFASGAKLYRG